MEFSRLPELDGTEPCRKCFKYTVVLWNESKILMRILYKAKNQLSHWKPYKKAIEVQRYLKRVALMEHWFNRAPLVSYEEVRTFLGLLNTFELLLISTKQVCQSSFFHHDQLLSQALFVQHSMAVAAIIARINTFLGKVQTELTRERRKALLKVADKGQRGGLMREFNIPAGDLVEDESSNILVVSDVKEGKRPPPPDKSNQQDGLKRLKTVDEIDDIFGAF